MPEIITAKNISFCFGVSRAVSMLDRELLTKKNIFCLGEIVHNNDIVEKYKKLGVKFINYDKLDEIKENDSVIIRAHGADKNIIERLKSRNIKVVDATCTDVKRIHEIVEKLPNDEPLIILGDKTHPEIIGIISFSNSKPMIFDNINDADSYIKTQFDTDSRFNIITQTTFDYELYKNFSKHINNIYTNAFFFDTICKVTEKRQTEVFELSRKCDAVIVVGGKNSSNTRKLVDIANKNCDNVFSIENSKDLTDQTIKLLKRVKTIAIITGASTPINIITEVQKSMSELQNTEVSFEELLNQTFKSLTTGEKVTGTILAVNAAEIKVDLGTKHTGILVYDEITTEPGVNLLEEYHVGDQIEVVCTKFSDVEGTVMLSKKRLEMGKHFDELVSAVDSVETLYGTVKDVIRGGLLVNVKTMSVFVPASQSGLSRDADLNTLKGKKVPLKIIEVNQERRRAVGSIRNAQKGEQMKETDEFYSTIEVGQKFKGKVRSLTSYGAFVNIGPVDGMVHITELSWGRLNNPADLLKEGQLIDVYIKGIDLEKRRISLGYKTEESNPRKVFALSYKVGDKLSAKVVSLVPFGVFAEIIPGIDGLIHNTQIGEKYQVPNSLKLGDVVDVAITAIDLDKNRISLSIKAAESDEALARAIEDASETKTPKQSIETAETPQTVEVTENAETTEITE